MNRVTGLSGETVQVEPKIMQVLLALVERPGDVVTREELMARVWNGVFVTDDALHRAIRELRRLFQDDAEAPRFIETIRKRGYRLIAPVEAIGGSGPATGVIDEGRRRGSDTGVRDQLVLAVGVAVIAIAAVTRFEMTHADTAQMPPRLIFMPMTSEPGNEIDPALSASGRLAYVARGDDGRGHVFAKAARDARGVQVTRGDATDHAPVWSPDERQIAFVRTDADGCRILIAAADGSDARTAAPCASRLEFKMSWSPDGRLLALTAGDGRHSSPSHLEILSIADGGRRALTQPPAGHAGDYAPAFSPDGRFVAFVRVVSGGITTLCVTAASGGSVSEVTSDGSDILGVDWSPDGRHLVYSSDRAGAISLWRIAYPPGEAARAQPELLAGGGSKLKHPTVARRTGIVAYEEWQYEINLREIATDTDEAPESPTTISATSDRWNFHPQLSPDGRQIVFQSTRSGRYELWIGDREGAQARPITQTGVYKSAARWSPDGHRVAFISRSERDGGFESAIEIVTVATGETRRLATTPGPMGFVAPSWSHDGRTVYAGGDRGGFHIYGVDVATGAIRTVHDGGFAAIESADGRWLYVARLERPGLWRMPAGGGEETLVTDRIIGEQWPNWGSTTRGVYFVGYPDAGDPQLFFIDDGATMPRPSARLPEFAWPGITVSRDGSRVIYAHADRRSANIGGLSER